MQSFGQFHPLIVHTPVALLIFSAFFAIVGRLFDRDWVRKASVLLLVFGFLGAFAAVRTGLIAHRVPEHQQGVPEHDIDEHGEMGQYALWASGLAVLAVFMAARASGSAAQALGGLALVLQVAAAVCVGVAGFRGGALVYEHGANVRIGGALVHDTGVGAAREGDAVRAPDHAAPRDSAAVDRDDDR